MLSANVIDDNRSNIIILLEIKKEEAKSGRLVFIFGYNFYQWIMRFTDGN